MTTARPSYQDPAAAAETRRAIRERWREEYGDQVTLIIALRDRRAELDKLIPDLWHRFYSEDDPLERETVARTNLDAGLKERRDLDGDLANAESALEEMNTAANAEGAEPGWFRDLDARLRMDGE